MQSGSTPYLGQSVRRGKGGMTVRSMSVGRWILLYKPHTHGLQAENTHLVVEVAVDRVSCCVDHLEGVGTIAIHVAVAIRDASVTEEEWDLVGGLWTKGDEVPEHIYILVGRKGIAFHAWRPFNSCSWRMRNNSGNSIYMEHYFISPTAETKGKGGRPGNKARVLYQLLNTIHIWSPSALFSKISAC